MSRRNWVALAAPLTAAALALSACGGSASDPQGQAPPAEQGSWDINEVDPATLTDGGELKWPVDQLPDNWNTYQLNGAVVDGKHIIDAVMPKLHVADKAGEIQVNGNYLESATLTSQDPQVVTYKLNPRARWNDGTPLSWADFDAQAKALNGTNAEYSVATTTGYEDIEKVEQGASAQEVEVTFKRKFGEWTSLFTPLYPASLNATPAEFNTGWQSAPKATAGPFKVGTIDQTAKLVTLVRDDAWWGAKPKLDKITFRVVDRSALADSLASGAIDFYTIGSSVDLFQRAKTIAGATVRQAPGTQYNQLTFNGAPTSILADKALRVAVTKALDPVVFAKGILGPIATDPQPLGNHFFLTGTSNYQDNSAPVKADKEAARAELDKLGWRLEGEFREKDGKQLDIRLVSGAGNPITEQISKLTQAQLKEVGVNVVIDAVPSATFFKEYLIPGNFDLVVVAWKQDPWPISSSREVYFLDPNAKKQNYGAIGSAEINAKLLAANAEFDDAKRVALIQEVDKLIWAEGHQLPLYLVPGTRAVRSTLANFGSFGVADPDYAKIGFTG
ncbi:ABC transporter family substrate-binding protein [Actinokineospora sp. G85]|uniref:ABC transporter family substrate-binding protein n=1 Tax=Actinokineospora sp. G85 TaxID=3406626 RepID=UPI003C7780BF